MFDVQGALIGEHVEELGGGHTQSMEIPPPLDHAR